MEKINKKNVDDITEEDIETYSAIIKKRRSEVDRVQQYVSK